MTGSFPDRALCKEQLEKGLVSLKIEPTTVLIDSLLCFLEMLLQWNERFNLTAVREPIHMVSRHVLDSLSILPYLHGKTVLDVGTGAGLPGIPLSIADSARQYYLLDSNQKKQVFVTQVVRRLALANAFPLHTSVERYQPAEKFSTIVTRAFAPISRMIALTQHLLAPQGRFLAMIGKTTADRLEVPEGCIIEAIISLEVPGEHADRHLAIIKVLTR